MTETALILKKGRAGWC